MVVLSQKTGTVLFTHSPDIRLMPASNMKLVTSAAALLELGATFRFKTSLRARNGNIEDGRLYGDLYLVGGGDPTLMPADLDKLAGAVRKAGIVRIVGRVVGDDSRFDAVRFGEAWSWDYLAEGYAAPVGALCLNRNVVRVRVGPGEAPGSSAKVWVDPAQNSVEIVSTAITGPSGARSDVKIERPFGANHVVASGAVAADAKEPDLPTARIAVADPARFAASVLTAKLRAAGIAVDFEAASGTAPAGTDEIGAFDSPPLSVIVALLNKPSDNLIAECLLKALGAEKGGRGTAEAGRGVVLERLKAMGLDSSALRVADGSGLSRRNFLTARFLASLLRRMAETPEGEAFRASLPIAGKDGTLSNRLKGTSAEGNVRAKTGFIGEVSSLSGYVKTQYGDDLVFAIIMNNHSGTAAAAREAQDRIAALLAGWNSPAG